MQRVLPRLITFDAAGTLMAPVGLEICYKEVALNHGLPALDVSKAMCTFWLNYTRLRREQPIFGRNSGLGWRLWWCSLVNQVFTEQYPDLSPVILNRLVESVMECYSTRRGWTAFDGANELLLRLSFEPGLVLGIISNSDERLERVLTCMNIRRYFSFVLTSYSLGAEKPSPAMFQEALHLSSRGLSTPIAPTEALHVGNRSIDDYVGARGSGWKAILVNRSHRALPPFVDRRHVVTTINHLHWRLLSILRPNRFASEPKDVVQPCS